MGTRITRKPIVCLAGPEGSANAVPAMHEAGNGGPCPSCAKSWQVFVNDVQVGQITSAICSPRLKRNVGLSLIDKNYWDAGQSVTVHTSDGQIRPGKVSRLPFK